MHTVTGFRVKLRLVAICPRVSHLQMGRCSVLALLSRCALHLAINVYEFVCCGVIRGWRIADIAPHRFGSYGARDNG